MSEQPGGSKPIVVVGGYGVFGGLVAAELAREGHSVVIAGRDATAADRAAAALGRRCRGVAADITDPASCRSLARQASVVCSCAGPFSALGSTLLDACIEAGCHHVDIADDRGFVRSVRARGEELARRGVAAVTGCSSLPAISGALAVRASRARAEPPAGVRVTLFIGNDNPKGLAAVRSAVALLGRPIETPQGTLRGFRDRQVVDLPPPFGRRAVYNFDSPELDLFPELLGTTAVIVKVGFELRLATASFATLAALGSSWGERTARLLAWVGPITRGIGCSGGAVMVELRYADGGRASAALVAEREGQRMAALPCAYVAAALASGGSRKTGALLAYELLDPDALLAQLVADGCSMVVG